MKKILFLLVAMLGIASCSSCVNGDGQFGIEYAFQSEGKTDGSFTLQVVSADFSVNGDAEYAFNLSSKDVAVAAVRGVRSLDQALGAKGGREYKAAKKVEGWLDEAVKVTAFEGHYDIYVRGYVKETLTGLTFSVDRHFSNYPERNLQ